MQDWMIEIIDRFGYWGVALLIAIENLFPPIPSEVILTFGGFMTTYTSLKPFIVAIAATIGSVGGAVTLYGVGRLVTPQRLGLFIDKWGGVLRVKKDDIKKAEGWFLKRGNLTVFFCRFIPIVRSLISIPAGMAHMNMAQFVLFTTLGTAIWNVVLIYLGAFAGDNWHTIVDYLDTYSHIMIAVLVVVAICCIGLYLYKRQKRKV